MMLGNRGEISNFFARTGKRGPRTADILWLIRRKKISNCAAVIRQTIPVVWLDVLWICV